MKFASHRIFTGHICLFPLWPINTAFFCFGYNSHGCFSAHSWLFGGVMKKNHTCTCFLFTIHFLPENAYLYFSYHQNMSNAIIFFAVAKNTHHKWSPHKLCVNI